MLGGHSNSAHAGLGGGGVVKMRANACMGEGGGQGHACARRFCFLIGINAYITIHFLRQCMGFPCENHSLLTCRGRKYVVIGERGLYILMPYPLPIVQKLLKTDGPFKKFLFEGWFFFSFFLGGVLALRAHLRGG